MKLKSSHSETSMKQNYCFIKFSRFKRPFEVTFPSTEGVRFAEFKIADFKFRIQKNNRIATKASCACLKLTQIRISNFKVKIPNHHKDQRTKSKDLSSVAASKFYGQAKGLISSGQLSTLLHLHIHPINLVVYEESHWQE